MATPLGLTWYQKALCRNEDIDPDLWFPDRHDTPQARRAKTWCNVCPVKNQCLSEALALQAAGLSVDGIWGGTDWLQRKSLHAA